MRRTISGMIGTRSLAHNRRDFIAENVDPDRVHLNICYQNENLKEVYKELFDDSVERYNVGKRKDRQITNYYEKIRQGKQEKLFHEVIFQIGNREDMAVGTTEGDLAVKVLDEYVKNFQQRNPTLHVFSCYLHQDEATPHLHIDFVPYVTGWKGKGMDTRVSLKQALKSLGFQGGNKHDTELNQWINHEKELLAEIARQHRIEWEQKGTHEEHLDVYNFKKKECRKEVQALEQEKEYLTAENEGLTAQIAEARADIQLLKDDKEQAVKDKEEAEKRAEKAEKDLHSLEERRERLQPVMDNVSKEIKEYGTVKTLLPEAGALERATTYRDKKIKPLFTQVKNKIAATKSNIKYPASNIASIISGIFGWYFSSLILTSPFSLIGYNKNDFSFSPSAYFFKYASALAQILLNTAMHIYFSSSVNPSKTFLANSFCAFIPSSIIDSALFNITISICFLFRAL